MEVRSLNQADLPTLQSLLLVEPAHNVFHLSGLREHGIAESMTAPQGRPWAVGVLRDNELVGVTAGLRGTGGIYHTPGDDRTLAALAEVVMDRVSTGSLSLLSGHASQIGLLLPLIGSSSGVADICSFRTLYPEGFDLPDGISGFGAPRLAGDDDIESLIDFYETGFYSLVNLPTRAAWRNRLSEQLAFRTLFIIEDGEGRVASAALSSAETDRTAMLGGVATLEQYRGRGLSTLCVGALCAQLFRSGKFSVSLFYLKDNLPAASVYDKLGFIHAGEWILAPVGLGVSFGPLLNPRAH